MTATPGVLETSYDLEGGVHMRLVLIALLATGCAAFGQHGGGGHGGGGFRGSGTRGAYHTPPPVNHVHSAGNVVLYPVFYGGYYYYDPSMYYNGAPDQAPPPGYNNGYAAGYPEDNGAPGQSPIVILNQNFRPETANPVMRDYSNTALPPPGPMTGPPQSETGPAPNAQQGPDDQPVIYLIAMKDHTIFPAVAYWVDGDTLNYITTEGRQNRASLSLVDRDFSKQLNDQRGVEFKLPAPK